MEAVRICDAFGWTYDQYLKQPKWFIELLIGKRLVDKQIEANKLPK